MACHYLFIEKVRDIVSLYLQPTERAVVLCVDEKSQIQALDRTQPLLPMRPGSAQKQTHDYGRHGTPSLFAALNVATGEVIGHCFRKHRSVEFKQFLDTIDKAIPAPFDIHLVLDNYGTHKTAMIHNWLARRTRYQLHFTPTSASWINQVERWFAAITRQQIRRGTHRSTQALEKASGGSSAKGELPCGQATRRLRPKPEGRSLGGKARGRPERLRSSRAAKRC